MMLRSLTRPILLPMAERLGRAAMRRRGVRTRWVPTPEATLHAYELRGRGDLPTIVVLHGLGSGSTSFGPLMVRLGRDARRVLAVDYPGHGFSSAPAAALTADTLIASVTHALDVLLDDGPAILVGSSLGGAVALRLAVARPDLVEALVLVSPAGAQSTDEELGALKRIFQMTSRSEAIAFLERLYPHPPRYTPWIAHELPGMFARPAVTELLASTGNGDMLAPRDLTALEMPILLLWGQEEHLLPPSHLAYFQRYLPPHAIIERPAGFGHCPHVDACEALALRIVSFARTVAARSGHAAHEANDGGETSAMTG